SDLPGSPPPLASLASPALRRSSARRRPQNRSANPGLSSALTVNGSEIELHRGLSASSAVWEYPSMEMELAADDRGAASLSRLCRGRPAQGSREALSEAAAGAVRIRTAAQAIRRAAF